MAGNHRGVFGIYRERQQVEEAVEVLREAGFRNSDLSILSPGNAGSTDKAPVLAGALGWLAGIGALAIPGAGPFVAASPAMGMLAGGRVGRARSGGMLLSVDCDNADCVKRAEDILKGTGAADVSSTEVADRPESEKLTPHVRVSVTEVDDLFDVDPKQPRVRSVGGFDI